MRKLVLFCCICSLAFSVSAQVRIKSFGIVDPMRISINEKNELSTHPVLFLIMPHASWNHKWWEDDQFRVRSIHGFRIPSLLLRSIAREGAFGILPKESMIPFIFTTKHQIQGEMYGDKFLFKLRMGAEFGLNGNTENLTTIDYPLLFPRSHTFTNSFLWENNFIFSLEFYGKSTDGCTGLSTCRFLFLDAKINHFILPTAEDNYFALETSLALRYERFTKGYKLGVKYSSGSFPFGNMDGVFPFLDVVFKIR
ncbi:MAG: hypothetical protein GY827_03495 [Cytophagales bacterium]|nr:hypothetical protein [Cytophagales bacterium]